MKQIAITSLIFYLSIVVSAQEKLKPLKPQKAVKSPTGKIIVPATPMGPLVKNAVAETNPVALLPPAGEPLPLIEPTAFTPEVPALPGSVVLPAFIFYNLPEVPPAPEAPLLFIEELSDDGYKAFLTKNPTIRSIRWAKNSVIVRLKNGKEERYTMDNAISMNQIIQKYGELPPPPPPPPHPVPPPPPPIKRKA